MFLTLRALVVENKVTRERPKEHEPVFALVDQALVGQAAGEHPVPSRGWWCCGWALQERGR